MPQLVADLFAWLPTTDAHPLVASSVFHYAFAFIHPFADGNGRMGRLWQSLILARWHALFGDLPEKPNGRLQRDHITDLGRQWLADHAPKRRSRP